MACVGAEVIFPQDPAAALRGMTENSSKFRHYLEAAVPEQSREQRREEKKEQAYQDFVATKAVQAVVEGFRRTKVRFVCSRESGPLFVFHHIHSIFPTDFCPYLLNAWRLAARLRGVDFAGWGPAAD
eukprot:SAG31_NODE_3268_length_4478_cov_2.701987_5_plen_127_part_00